MLRLTLLPVILINLLGLRSAFGQHDPHFAENRSVIVHLFEWKFEDIANECESFLGPKGFGGVQVSPVNENIIRKEDYGRPWWERYQPMSYKIQTRSGNENEFLTMSKRCNQVGVRIYVDVVLNHMAAELENDEEMIGTAGSIANATTRDYPGVPYVNEDFHKECIIEEYNDGHVIRNCQLGTLPDLDHSKESVKMKITEYLNHLIDLGAAGFRIDAAKHIWPVDLRDIYGRVKNLSSDFDFPPDLRPFFYQEVIDLGGEAISKTEYSGYGVVTEFLYSTEIGAIFNGKKALNTLINWGPSMGFLSQQDALVFIDNHDNQRGHGTGGDNLILTHKSPKKYEMAVSFMLAHPYGIKRLMSSYRFVTSDQGPPADDDDNIISPLFDDDTGQCINNSSSSYNENTTTWVCEHRWQSIVNMVEFSNIVKGQTITNWQDNGLNQIAFCRGNKGFIAFNNDPFVDYITKVVACLEPGDYCDVISGAIITTDENGTVECSGLKLTINDDGYANIFVPFNGEHGVIAIHENSKVGK